MSGTQLVITAAIAVYFIGMLAVGFFYGRKQDAGGFTIGNRRVGVLATSSSLAAGLRDGMGILFWFGFGAATGYGGMWLAFGVLTAFIFYAFIGPAAREIADRHGYVTIGEFIRDEIGPYTEKAASLLIIVFSLMYMAIQLYVSGNLFASVLDMPPWVGVAGAAAIVAVYLLFGGYSTVIITDVIQFFLIISLITLPFFFSPPIEAITNFQSLFSLPKEDSFALLLIGVLFVLSTPDIWQRVFSARDTKTIRYSFPLSGFYFWVMTLSVIFIGMAAAPFMGESMKADNALFLIFDAGFMPDWMLAWIAVVVLAVSMSTLDTYCYLSSSTLAKNFLAGRIGQDHAKYVRFTRYTMAGLLVIMSLIAFSITDVIKFLFNAASIMYVLIPIYLAAASGRVRRALHADKLLCATLVVSCAVYIYMFSTGAFDRLILTLVPSICAVILTLGVVIYSKKAGVP